MAENTQNLENNELNAYQETLQWYKQLEEVFRQPQCLISVKTHLSDICIGKIQNLINMEAANLSTDNFNTDIYQALYLLQKQLVCLKNKNCQLPKFSLTPNVTTQINNTQLQAKDTNENEQQLHSLITATQVIPRVKGLEDIGGLAGVKKTLEAIVILPIYQPQLYTSKKICSSILLYGPPGTGKTGLVHALAAEVSACLFSVSASDILSHYIGQTEKLVRALFQTVKEKRSCSTILFMDEIDGLFRRRNDTEAEWNRRLKAELMCQLSAFEDHSNIFFICATNCPWDLDTAFLRRFQQRIYVPLPNRPDRFDLLKIFTEDTPLQTTSNYWGDLLHQTEGYSGSDLADLVRNAVNIPKMELINNTRWELVGDNIYQPAQDSANFDKVIQCTLRDLPKGSVRARPVQVSDLTASVDVVKRTVLDTHIQQYARFKMND